MIVRDVTAHDHRLVVESACGAALAAVYERLPVLNAFNTALVIVCGGVTATLAQLQAWSSGYESIRPN